MPTWPTSLPQRPLVDGYGEQPPDLIVRSPIDVGWAKTRKRASAGPTRITATYAMTGTQLGAFDAFVAGELADRTGLRLAAAAHRRDGLGADRHRAANHACRRRRSLACRPDPGADAVMELC